MEEGNEIRARGIDAPGQSRDAADEGHLRAIHAVTLGLRKTTDFPRSLSEQMALLGAAGLSFSNLSLYLITPNTKDAIHYYLYPAPSGWERVTLEEGSPELKAYLQGKTHTWPVGPREGVWHLTVPISLGAVTLSDVRSGGFAASEEQLLKRIVLYLEMMVVRHRDLLALEGMGTKALQTDADLVALHDGSHDLSGETGDEVAKKTIEMVVGKLSFERVGIFLCDAERKLLRGTWGVDAEGKVVSITSTEFPLNPGDEERMTEIAQIARGEMDYFLTQDLDGEGRKSVEGDIRANLLVPMRVGDRIVGVLAVDNYFTDRGIEEDEVQPLMILANQAGAAMENARLYETLRLAYGELEERVKERTAELARTNSQLQEEVRERQRAEEQLKAWLEEKEMLLKEVHHRVKNNLAVVSSMLSLQSMEIEDERYRRLFQDSQNRIQSVALIHEKLYMAREMGRIGLEEYIPDLVREIFESQRPDDAGVELRVQVDEVSLEVDPAIHCGLIINELMTNALKHAFPTGQQGTVGIEMSRQEGGMLELVVWNDGKGLPEDVDTRQGKSLGLRLVDALVTMVKGRLQVQGGDVTRFSVIFPYQSPS
jgi:two-component sensor histidine kinase